MCDILLTTLDAFVFLRLEDDNWLFMLLEAGERPWSNVMLLAVNHSVKHHFSQFAHVPWKVPMHALSRTCTSEKRSEVLHWTAVRKILIKSRKVPCLRDLGCYAQIHSPSRTQREPRTSIVARPAWDQINDEARHNRVRRVILKIHFTRWIKQHHTV